MFIEAFSELRLAARGVLILCPLGGCVNKHPRPARGEEGRPETGKGGARASLSAMPERETG